MLVAVRCRLLLHLAASSSPATVTTTSATAAPTPAQIAAILAIRSMAWLLMLRMLCMRLARGRLLLARRRILAVLL